MTIASVNYSVTRTVDATSEPLTTNEAKDHLRVERDFTDDDTLIDALVTVARGEVERFLYRQLITATYVLRLDEWPSGDVIDVPWPNLLTVTSLAYNDTDGNSQTLTVDEDYSVDIYSTPGRVLPYYNTTWPSTYGHINDITLTYTAGYGSSASDIPPDIIHAVRLYLGHYYEHREAFVVGAPIAKFETAERLLYPYRVHGTF